MDWPASVKIKTKEKKWTKEKIDDIIEVKEILKPRFWIGLWMAIRLSHNYVGHKRAYVHMNKYPCKQNSFLQFVCTLNSHSRAESAAIQDTNKVITDHQSCQNWDQLFDKPVSCPQRISWFLCNYEHERNTQPLLTACFFVSWFLWVVRFACGVWQLTGRGVV